MERHVDAYEPGGEGELPNVWALVDAVEPDTEVTATEALALWCDAASRALVAWSHPGAPEESRIAAYIDALARPFADRGGRSQAIRAALHLLGKELDLIADGRSGSIANAAGISSREEATPERFFDNRSDELWAVLRGLVRRTVNRRRRRADSGETTVTWREHQAGKRPTETRRSRRNRGVIEYENATDAIRSDRADAESWRRLARREEESMVVAKLLRHGADCVYRQVESPVVGRELWKVISDTGRPTEKRLTKPEQRLEAFVAANAVALAIEEGRLGVRFEGAERNDELPLSADASSFERALNDVVKHELRPFRPDDDPNTIEKAAGRLRRQVAYLACQLCSAIEGLEHVAEAWCRLVAEWQTGGAS